MSDLPDRPNRIPWPPLVYGAAILAAVAAHWAYPLGWLPPPFNDVLAAAGWLIAAAGLALDIAAIRTMRGADTTVLPTKASSHLVTNGVFAISRNPIYLGNTLLMVGVGFAFGIVWFFLFALAAALATQKLAIEPEEKHLEHKFGKRFRDYKKKVRRWL